MKTNSMILRSLYGMIVTLLCIQAGIGQNDVPLLELTEGSPVSKEIQISYTARNNKVPLGSIQLVFVYSRQNGIPQLQLNMTPSLTGGGSISIYDKKYQLSDLQTRNRTSYPTPSGFTRTVDQFYLTTPTVLLLKNAFETGVHFFSNRSTNLIFSFTGDINEGDPFSLQIKLYYGTSSGRIDRVVDPIKISLRSPVKPIDPIGSTPPPPPPPPPDTTNIKPPPPDTTNITPPPGSTTETETKAKDNCAEMLRAKETELNGLVRDIARENFEGSIQKIKQDLEKLENLLQADPNEAQRLNMRNTLQGITNEITDQESKLGQFENKLRTFDRGIILLRTNESCNTRALEERFRLNLEKLSNHRNDLRDLYPKREALLKRVDPGFMETRDSINRILSPRYDSLTITMKKLVMELDILSSRFMKKKINQQLYFSWQENEFKQELARIDSTFLEQQKKFDELRSKSEELFSRLLNLPRPDHDPITQESISLFLNSQNVINEGIKRIKDDMEQYSPRDPWLPLLGGLLVLMILIFGISIYVRAIRMHRRRKRMEYSQKKVVFLDEPGRKKVGGITISHSERSKKIASGGPQGKGLRHVYDKIDQEYYEIDLEDIWEDTSVSKAYIHRNCIIKSYELFYDSLRGESKAVEYGGYIIGNWDHNPENLNKYDVSLDHFIEPGDDAVHEEYLLNFGAKIGIRLENTIRKIFDQTGRSMTLTAWFHSHPQLKIFLSERDLDVQEMLSGREYKRKLLALVIDPNTLEDGRVAFNTGIFSYRTDESMNNNGESMKLIRWKDLYDWAKLVPLVSLVGYHRIRLTDILKLTQANALYMSNGSIIDLSMLINNNPNGSFFHGRLVGRIYNEQLQKNRLIAVEKFEALQGTTIEVTDNTVGYYFYLSDNDTIIDEIISLMDNKPTVHLIMFCDNPRKELYILTRDYHGRFNRKQEVQKTYSFSKLEALPTKLR